MADDIGRPAVSRSDARLLIAERREAEAQQARKREVAERQAIEADRLWRAQLSPGVPASMFPDGVAPAAPMLQASRDAQPKWTSVLQEALSNSGGLVFHPLHSAPDES